MGKYSNIAVSKLKSHTVLAKQELATNDFSNIKTEFNKTLTLQSSVNNVINVNLDAFESSDTLNGTRKNIKKILDNLENACSCIESIQMLEKEIANLEARKWKTETSKYIDAFGKEHTSRRTVIDQSIVNEINRKKRSLSEYETKADRYLS